MTDLPKILKIANKYPTLPSFVDSLLNDGYSLRVIADKVRRSYSINMSYESIRRYRNYMKSLQPLKAKCETLMIVKPIKKTS